MMLLIFIIIAAIFLFIASLILGGVWVLFGDLIIFIAAICIISKIIKLFKGKK